MLKRGLSVLFAVGAASVLGVGCGDSGDDGNSGGSTSGTGGEFAPDVRDVCPDFEGPDAQQGDCCYRGVPNSQRFDEAPDGVVELEYRLNWQFTINHPSSLSFVALRDLAIPRNEGEQQSLLVRFEVPKQDGELVAGDGVLTIGQGRYNCDGTYSFYTDGAAPVLTEEDRKFPNSEDSGRWEATAQPFEFDPDKSGVEQVAIEFASRYRGKSYTPFLDATTFDYDWEIVTEFLDLSKWDDISVDELDCVGNRTEAGGWNATGEFTVFARLDDNFQGDNGINALNGITFAQLVAFGLAAPMPTPDPTMLERCEPGTTGCDWVKLPDSLCPNSDDERDIFSCHLGDENNADQRETNCTATAPETPRDDPDGDQGQCCDPLGESTELPACNAYLLVNEFVAASAEITDDPVGEIQKECTN